MYTESTLHLEKGHTLQNHDLLEKVLTGVMDEDLRNDVLRHLFKSGERRSAGIPMLKNCQRQLDNGEIFARMKKVAGGTSVSVARKLNISPQAYNNQIRRGNISAKSIIDLHLKTGVSVDWLIGSWDGSSADYLDQNLTVTEANEAINQPTQKYLSLVEIYDQHSGNDELKWCLSKRQDCRGDDNLPIPADFGALHSLIIRYKDESGTPEKVKNGGKRHFQVRKVLAYVLGDPKLISKLDDRAKKLTVEHMSDLFERTGKTEFRQYTAKNDCLRVLKSLAEQYGLIMVEPELNTIAWDFLIGSGSMSPRDWVLEKLRESTKTA
ncbi:MAG: hypothetical protein H7Y42_18050 [Chitinophagaceae bacterium]|nr:hypothetical protein [Chitinophagaceae bacterium]